MRACFVDAADLPITCCRDTGEIYNCTYAAAGVEKKDCHFWDTHRAVNLALEILGVKDG